MEQIEEQLEKLGFYAQNQLSTQAERINEIESFLFGVIDTLVKDRLVDHQTLQENVLRAREEAIQKGEQIHAGVAIRNDAPEHTITEEVNCEERMHICKAVCCRMRFALSAEEIESGKVKWDLGQPYSIRQGKDGYCVHCNEGSKACGIYNDRPKVCSNYSCRHDQRIWKDFEKMELNQEWIDQNIGAKKARLVAAQMSERIG